MIIFKYAWELVKLVGWAAGTFMGGMAAVIVCVFAIGFFIQLLFGLSYVAQDQPVLGVPLLVVAVVFCLWCAFFQKGASTPPQTVLRGPLVVKSEEHPIHIRIRRGSGEVKAEPEDSESPVTGAPRRP